MKKVMRDLNECGPWRRTAEHLRCGRDCFRNLIGAGDPASKARERPKDIRLLRRFVQSAARLSQQRRSDVAADQEHRRVGLQALKKWDEGKQITGPGGGKDGSHPAAAAEETVCCKARRLLVTNHPMMK